MRESYDPDLLEKKTVTARKKHECGECQKTIVEGEQYVRIAFLWKMPRRSVDTLTLCRDCVDDWNVFHRDVSSKSLWVVCGRYGKLGELVEEAYNRGLLPVTHPLVRRWLPEEFRASGIILPLPGQRPLFVI